MEHLYLFTLEIASLEVGKAYDELPPHLTLVSRFLSDLPPDELAATVRPLLAKTSRIHLVFGETTVLGPKKVTAHLITSTEERRLHDNVLKLLDTTQVAYQYPEFIGENHKPHVTARKDVRFDPGSEHIASATYLIEVVYTKRVVRAKFTLNAI
ncbi:MAG TPA: 2'-5' RNA ligase family protein [Candidatus Saccharimonadales bacterium]|nr:2'-5' RNA ligase family protein [Candidatus Saccharimonadales bacterium]